MTKQLFLIAILTSISFAVFSQKEEKRDQKGVEIIEDRVEKIAEVSEEEEMDLTTLFDELYYYYEHPINLNNTDFEQLRDLYLLTDFQISNLFEHIEKNGKLISIYELQSIDGWTLETIRNVLPFVKVADRFDSPHISLREMMNNGSHELFLRYTRLLEEQVGFSDIADSVLAQNPNKRYLGDPSKIYMRYRFKFGQNVSWGLTGEKDQGEEFFKGTQKQGFDFYSAHLFLKNIGVFKHIAVGDYQLQLGQGLTFWSGRAFRKSADVINVKRNAQVLKAYTSVDENNFMRGAAATAKLNNFQITGFLSSKKLDANITPAVDSNGDILVGGNDDVAVSSFLTSGFHRTPNEIQDKDAISETIFGTHIRYIKSKLSVGATAVQSFWGADLNRNLRTYNQFDFNSNKNLNLGLDYSYLFKNFNFFGEFSRSANGGVGYINGALITLDPRLALSVIHRNYQRNYQSVYSGAFGELSKSVNEKGLYLGLDSKLTRKWRFSAYFDQFEFPWLRSNITAPSSGVEYLAQLTWRPSRKLQIYGRYKQEIKEQNPSSSSNVFDEEGNIVSLSSIEQTAGIDELQTANKQNFRIDAAYKLSDAVKLKSRVEASQFTLGENGVPENGFLIYQDLAYKPLSKPYSFNFRYALFDTDTYNARIYAYENDVLYLFSVPAYYNRGTKAYITLRYRVVKGFDIWLRYSRTNYNDVDVISSGLNQINGNTRSEVRAQIRIKL